MSDGDQGEKFIARLARYAASGIGPLSSAAELADEYARNPKYRTPEERIDALIRWESAKNFTSGFITGLGGLITLPIAIPAALGAAWVIQARLAVAIAILAGYDGTSDQVRSVAVWALLGDGAKEAIKQAGIQIGKKGAEKMLQSMSARIFMEINKKVGFRLITKAGERSIVSLVRFIPIAGGLVGGTIDAVSTQLVGKLARELFPVRDDKDGGEAATVAA